MSTKVGKKQSAIAAAVTISYMILASSSVVFLDMGLQQAFGGTFPGTNGKIAFDSDRTGTEQIFVMNADGSGQTNLSNNFKIDNFAPSWSPDGTKIAFYSDRTGTFQIFVMNADGSGQINLSNNAIFDENPSWSPDGTKIPFHTERTSIEPIDMISLVIAGIFTITISIFYNINRISGSARLLFKCK